MSHTKTQLVRCPACGKDAEYSSNNPFRPFCSERCQTIDLGAWADESYRVPVDESETATVNENSREDEGSEASAPPKHHLN